MHALQEELYLPVLPSCEPKELQQWLPGKIISTNVKVVQILWKKTATTFSLGLKPIPQDRIDASYN